MIKTKTIYQSSDGKEFPTMEEAQSYEDALATVQIEVDKILGAPSAVIGAFVQHPEGTMDRLLYLRQGHEKDIVNEKSPWWTLAQRIALIDLFDREWASTADKTSGSACKARCLEVRAVSEKK